MPQLAIVADDLTGAADTGACFAAVGLATLIRLQGTSASNADVVIVSTESRDLDGTAAAHAVRSAIIDIVGGQGDGEPRWIYKFNATQNASRDAAIQERRRGAARAGSGLGGKSPCERRALTGLARCGSGVTRCMSKKGNESPHASGRSSRSTIDRATPKRSNFCATASGSASPAPEFSACSSWKRLGPVLDQEP